MMEPQTGPSAQIVGQEFVKQYYTMLNMAPEHLHRFYSNNSKFVHGGTDGRPDDQQAVTGQAEIHQKIMSLNFNNCHARICQVDCQSSVGGSVVVQVIGELSNDGQPMRKFVQSFVLAPQSAKKYYVHIDIFRYQDIYPLNGDRTADGDYLEECEADVVAGEMISNESSKTEQPTVDMTLEETPQGSTLQLVVDGQESGELSNDVAVMTLDDSAPAPPAAAADEEHVENTLNTADDGVDMSEDVAQDDVIENTTTVDVEIKSAELTEPEVAVVAEPPKPLTWAALASRNAVTSSAVVINNTITPARPPVTTDVKPDASQPTKTPASSGTEERSMNGRAMVNGNSTGKDDVSAIRKSTSGLMVYPDNQQLFVGNVPQHLTDNDLVEFFEQYGKVVDFRINRKIGTGPSGNNVGQKNFGFMAFESPDTVQKILSGRPIFMRKHRLNIEEKKPREELAAARFGPSRGGGGFGASRRGGYGRVEVRSNASDEARTY